MCGPGLQNSTVGVVGLGRIGQEIVKRLKPFKVTRFLYCGRSDKTEAREIGVSRVSLDELLAHSDFVIVTCALTPETKEMFNDSLFEKMKSSAIFINVSRGGLQNSTVGVVGLGRIGQEIVKRLKPFKVTRFLYCGRSDKTEAREIGVSRVSLDELLAHSDFVIVTCALTPETKEMFNDSLFEKMKSSAIFINVSRGGVVDQFALQRALESKRILAAGLDVMTPEPLPPKHPLLQLSNCVILPHIGSATIQARKDMALLTVKNIIAGVSGTPMPAPLC
uniref:Glyoxylate reductase/hydroxypyruvate reductase n=1 Tax=Timema cristinae TaxID=61476 RepID=A0A7R9CHJ3_TIMCR|nr:unnamed protein product [Timema cristinae]